MEEEKERERDLLVHVQISPDRCRDEQTLGKAAAPTHSVSINADTHHAHVHRLDLLDTMHALSTFTCMCIKLMHYGMSTFNCRDLLDTCPEISPQSPEGCSYKIMGKNDRVLSYADIKVMCLLQS